MLWLIGILLVCHYLADYSHLTRPWMLAAKAKGSPVWPIFLHASVHTALMAVVLVTYKFIMAVSNGGVEIAVGPALALQLVSHTLIDVFKGKLNRFEAIKSPMSVWHWYVFGADQLLHQLVIICMVYICM